MPPAQPQPRDVLPASLRLTGRRARVGWLMLGALIQGLAGVPELNYLYPAGGQRGARFAVTAGGRLDPWPVSVWVDDPGIRFTPGETNGQFQVELAPQATPGAHLVRVYTPQGASTPLIFVVGLDPEITREPIAPNEKPKADPLPAPLPVTLNGQLNSAETPVVFPIEIGAECVVRARFVAGAIDSPAQANLALLKDSSTTLVTTQEPTGRDFEVRCPFPVGGTFQLQATPLTNSHIGDAAVFRVQVAAEPLVRLPQPVTTTADSDNVTAFRPMAVARTLAVPGLTRGVVSPAGRQIDYSFIARQNERFRFVARAGSIGSPLAPLLRVLDLERQVLAESLPAEDGELVWTARDDAEHLLAVSDARGQGGPTHAFQLEVARPQPQFSGVFEQDAVRLKPGEAAVCELQVLRPAASEDVLLISATGLPPGVTADLVQAASGFDRVRLTLTASAEAKPSNGPFRIMLMTTTEAPPRVEFARFRLRPRHGLAGGLLLPDSDQPWLTVLAAP